MKTFVQIHRFGDCVAMYLADGKTVYMTPKDAGKIAAQLRDCAKDVRAVKFGSSTFRTFSTELTDTGYNGCGFEVVRKD